MCKWEKKTTKQNASRVEYQGAGQKQVLRSPSTLHNEAPPLWIVEHLRMGGLMSARATTGDLLEGPGIHITICLSHVISDATLPTTLRPALLTHRCRAASSSAEPLSCRTLQSRFPHCRPPVPNTKMRLDKTCPPRPQCISMQINHPNVDLSLYAYIYILVVWHTWDMGCQKLIPFQRFQPPQCIYIYIP